MASTTDETKPTENYYEFNDYVCKNLYLNEDMSDVKFVFSDDENADERKIIAEIPSHKFLLSASSDVFRVMFNGSWKEKTEVEIDDSSPEAFKEFLQCIYLTKGTFTEENVHSVINLANKYQINHCVSACLQFLIDNPTPANVCLSYALVNLDEQSDLKQYCMRKITKNPSLAFTSDYFLNCDRNLLEEILKLNFICEETIVFDWCLAWAKNACLKNGLDENDTKNLRNQLGNCLYLIRFTTMKIEEISERTSKYDGLFEDGELVEIFHSIVQKENKSKNFNHVPRLCWDETKIWECRPELIDVKSSIEVSIISNEITLLGGFYCWLDYDLNDKNYIAINFDFKVMECPLEDRIWIVGKTIYIGNINIKINRHKSEKTFIPFSPPIVMNNKTKYKISLCIPNVSLIGFDKFKFFGYSREKITSPNGLQISFDTYCTSHFIAGLKLMDF